MTMNTTRTLILAALGALSLGVGSAMASGSGAGTDDYWAQQYRIQARQAAAANPNARAPVQYGSPDTQPGTFGRMELNSMAVGGG
jgi:hypothetical protein